MHALTILRRYSGVSMMAMIETEVVLFHLSPRP
jgi:hypothetical protein